MGTSYHQFGKMFGGRCSRHRLHGSQVEYDLLVGADGANSVVRSELMRSNPAMQGANPTDRPPVAPQALS